MIEPTNNESVHWKHVCVATRICRVLQSNADSAFLTHTFHCKGKGQGGLLLAVTGMTLGKQDCVQTANSLQGSRRFVTDVRKFDIGFD